MTRDGCKHRVVFCSGKNNLKNMKNTFLDYHRPHIFQASHSIHLLLLSFAVTVTDAIFTTLHYTYMYACIHTIHHARRERERETKGERPREIERDKQRMIQRKKKTVIVRRPQPQCFYFVCFRGVNVSKLVTGYFGLYMYKIRAARSQYQGFAFTILRLQIFVIWMKWNERRVDLEFLFGNRRSEWNESE